MKGIEIQKDKQNLVIKNERQTINKNQDILTTYQPRKYIDGGTTAAINRDRKMLNASQIGIRGSYSNNKLLQMPSMKVCSIFFFLHVFYLHKNTFFATKICFFFG